MKADTVRIFRMNYGWTQAGFAAQLGVRQATVSDWETGKVKVSPLAVRAMMLIVSCRTHAERLGRECDEHGELLKAIGTFNHKKALRRIKAWRKLL